jgi:hypothetical protein
MFKETTMTSPELTSPLEIRSQWIEYQDAYLHEAICQWYRTKSLMSEITPADGVAALKVALIGS